MHNVVAAQSVSHPPADMYQKMIDCHVLAQDGARLDIQGLRSRVKLKLAYRQYEQWESVSDETLVQHYSKRVRHNR